MLAGPSGTSDSTTLLVSRARSTPRKRAQDGEEGSGVVVTPEMKKSKRPTNDPWAAAMSVFAKYSPGLGHDGRGLYGSLTNESLRRMLERHAFDPVTTHLDIGAGDGKVMLGALALGVAHSFGVEIAGSALSNKFEAMRSVLASKIGAINAELRCEIDVADLDETRGIEGWLGDVFAHNSTAELCVTAVWHGFTVESKECVLKALAHSRRVSTFSLVGPVRKDYGNAKDVLEFFSRFDKPTNLLYDDKATLAGGESYRALTFKFYDTHHAARFDKSALASSLYFLPDPLP